MVKSATRILAATIGVGGMVAAGLPAASAQQAGPEVITSGLDNPRHLNFGADGSLYVAEAGVGGSGTCVTGPEGEACFGRSGAVTRIRGGAATRVLSGLPSLAGAGGMSATGPTDIQVAAGGRFTMTMGLGNNPAVREQLPAAGHKFGTVISGVFGSNRTQVADIAAFEAARDFDGQGLDSNPVGLAQQGDRHLVADAAANAIFSVRSGGKMAVVATLPIRMVPTPPFMPPGQMPMQSVPTDVVVGPDGAFYISELTGFPFPTGEARIYRMRPGQQPTVYATGLTNVTDLAWSGKSLYAVELSSVGLLNEPPGQPPTGALVKVTPGATNHPVVAGGLTAPYGVAVRNGQGYVTTCAVCADAGAVVRVPLN